MVDFPTRKYSILDNCLTNKPELFDKAFPVNTLLKTDHKGFIVPAKTKLKPIRTKHQLRDLRDNCKAEFLKSLKQQDWEEITNSKCVDETVDQLNQVILKHIDQCFPTKTVSISTRDPPWISPLVKHLLLKRSRMAKLSKQPIVQELTKRIGTVIAKNKENMNKKEATGSGLWWKKVDQISLRKNCNNIFMEKEFVHELNNYFANLCTDEHYVEPTIMVINNNISAPQLTESQVLKELESIKKTATGPDEIPFWIWKDCAVIFAPVITHIWNLSLANSTWPAKWKSANICALPKVETPINVSDYRGINVTSVIARAFERIVYKTFVKTTVEQNLHPSQFAYRTGSNCTHALLKIQNTAMKSLDKKECNMVRLFSMDFSKAFDNVKHDILARKLQQFPINPYISNWYLDFLKNRHQRVVFKSEVCEFKTINKGTSQGTVSGPPLFCMFINDLYFEKQGIELDKYADDSSLQIEVLKNKPDGSNEAVEVFDRWSVQNEMPSNTNKCYELVIHKKRAMTENPQPVKEIKQVEELKIVGVTMQGDGRFNKHVKEKLNQANKCLYILRGLRQQGYNQKEMDYLFKSLILPKITYGLSVYGASEPELTTVQQFLTRCYKRKYISEQLNIYNLLKSSDMSIFNKVKNQLNHPLRGILPIVKETSYDLRRKTCTYPLVKTERFKNCFINRLIFKYNVDF